MGLIPQEFIDEVTKRADILEIVGARVALKQKGRDFWGLCPFHKEKTPSFKVDPQKQMYYCFGCGESGSLLGFLTDYDRLTFPEAIEMLAERAGLEVPRAANSADRPNTKPLYDVMTEASRWFSKQLQDQNLAAAANAYLRERGLTDEVVNHFRLGFAPPGWDNLSRAFIASHGVERLIGAGLVTEKSEAKRFDRFRNRIMFPIRSTSGRVVAFGARVLDPEDEPKYLNSPETPLFIKGQHLYGLYEAGGAGRQDYLLFVEGYMDVIALTQAGIAGAVACMGTTVSEMQLKLAFRYVKKLFFCFDGDAAGRKAAARTLERLLPVLQDSHLVHFIFLPDGADPDSLVRDEGTEGFRERMASATTLSDFLFEHLRDGVDLGTIEGRAMLSDRALGLMRQVPGSNLRKLLLQSLGELTGLTYNDEYRPASQQPVQQQPQTRVTSGSGGGPNLVNTALSLLLQAPGEAEALQDEGYEWLKELDDPATVLLDKTLRILRRVPTDNSAVLLAQLGGDPDYDRLVTLYQSHAKLPEATRGKNFHVAWQRLKARIHTKQRKNSLQELRTQVDKMPDEEVSAQLARAFSQEQIKPSAPTGSVPKA